MKMAKASTTARIVKVHSNRVCTTCKPEIIFKSASGKRVHDQAIHGINHGMVAGSPRQRDLILKIEFTRILEMIIETGAIELTEIFRATKLPAVSIHGYLKKLEGQGVIQIQALKTVGGTEKQLLIVASMNQATRSFKTSSTDQTLPLI